MDKEREFYVSQFNELNLKHEKEIRTKDFELSAERVERQKSVAKLEQEVNQLKASIEASKADFGKKNAEMDLKLKSLATQMEIQKSKDAIVEPLKLELSEAEVMRTKLRQELQTAKDKVSEHAGVLCKQHGAKRSNFVVKQQK